MTNDAVMTAAHELRLAGRWDTAIALLGALPVESPADEAEKAVAIAEVRIWEDFFCATSKAPEVLLSAVRKIENAPDAAPRLVWKLECLQLVHAYFRAIIAPEGLRIGPEQHDEATKKELPEKADALTESAPSARHRGWALFWRGVITDNVLGQFPASPKLYEEAKQIGEEHGDDYLVSEALRHLGMHALEEDNDFESARAQWEQALVLRQALGLVPGSISQLLSLAELAKREGDQVRAGILAAEIASWADAIGIRRIADAARKLL